MKLRELLSGNKAVLTDGAVGTYYESLTGKDTAGCELANITEPEVIEKIHREYIEAGARIIRTNTFCANDSLKKDRETLARIITDGWSCAERASEGRAVICADISALYETPDNQGKTEEQYRFLADCFLRAGAQTFIFETLSELDAVMPAIDYILEKKPDAEIIVSFTLLPDGCTRSGVSSQTLMRQIKSNEDKLCAVGLNCGIGAVQLYPAAVPFLTYIRENTALFTMVMPNAGYPALIGERTVYGSMPSYFARETAAFLSLGVNAVGGCCGTSPEYIRQLGEYVSGRKKVEFKKIVPAPRVRRTENTGKRFCDKPFIIAAELDPPNNADLTKIISAAGELRDSGVDVITVSDSPLGHAKADPVICSARIKRETGIDVMPHICCRDRNINAIRSLLMGAHSEGIRAVLAVTGDRIAETDRGIVKPVFNMDSTKLMSLIRELNNSVFSGDEMQIGGAFDPGASGIDSALKRLDKKISSGASFVLTQPVFTDRAIENIRLAKQKNIRILAGIMPMVSLRNALFMQNEVPGMTIPDELVRKFTADMTREQAQQTGIEIAALTAQKLIPYVDGFYFITPFNRAQVVAGVIDIIKSQLK